MELIHYAAGAVLTGSDIAHALIAYAQALAKKATSATIDIPIREKDGTLGRANFLIGPASQIVSETVSSEFDEIEDPALVAAFYREAQKLDGVPINAADQPPMGSVTEQGLTYPDEY